MGFRDVFPDNGIGVNSVMGSFMICLAYMGTFILQGMLTRASQHDGAYRYNTTTAVIVSEVLKLATSFTVYVRGHSFAEYKHEVKANLHLLSLYFVPAVLYCVYNNLAFVNLSNYDPTTYYLLLQIRVVITGALFQFLFRRALSQIQWMSLGMLTLGCLIKEYRWSSTHDSESTDEENSTFYFYTALILVQVLCSCFAGVYNERLLKGEGQNVHLMVQNTFMYLDSVISNCLFLFIQGQLSGALSVANLEALCAPSVIALVINNAMIGIITSLFLQRLNSVVKVFASAVELIATAYLSWIIFEIPVDFYTFIALVLIVGASTVYSMYPIKQQQNVLPK